jgi:hypothetical protein
MPDITVLRLVVVPPGTSLPRPVLSPRRRRISFQQMATARRGAAAHIIPQLGSGSGPRPWLVPRPGTRDHAVIDSRLLNECGLTG